jgi:hypothetical protein
VASHHPAPLGDPTVAGEAEFLEHAFRPGVKVGASLRLPALDLFRVGLYDSATRRLDGDTAALTAALATPFRR